MDDCYFKRLDVGNESNALVQLTACTRAYMCIFRDGIRCSFQWVKREISHSTSKKMPSLAAMGEKGEFV